MMDKKFKLIEKLKSRYPSLEKDELMADLESEIVGMDDEEDDMMDMEEEMPMDEELGMEDEMMAEEDMGDEEEFMTEPDEEEDEDMAMMLALGKPKKKKKSY